MPTYLCHGFRWHRKSVRFYIAKHDIEDGATEWIVAPRSEAAIIDHFYSLYDFLPPANPPLRNAPLLAYRKHHHAPSNDSSYVSRTSSSEYHGSEDPTSSNGNSSNTRSRSASRRSSKSPSRPRTSGRDETTSTSTNTVPSPPLPLLSPSSIATKSFNYFDNPAPIKLIEEFDPKDESMASAPWAYVADHVVQVGTSVSVADEMFRYESRMKRDPNRAMHGPSDEYGRKVVGAGSKKAGWLEKLRDQLQRGESIRWYVVVCGDEERYNPTGFEEDGELLEEEEEEYEEEECEGSSARSQDRTWLRQSQSTQSTEATTMTTVTNPSVFEGGFEYRLPELAGLAARTPTVIPERKRDKLLAQPLPQKEFPAMLPRSPPKSPPLPQFANKIGHDSPMSARSARSAIGLRKLFSRRKSETSV
ncbi:hypothetical protein F5X97DRAFT_37304 [Nemania serpens]|nr:hypothetical protein F5X97DRAFT_37304 [Nemania serpens]